METISVSMGNRCIKDPPCSFCYLQNNNEIFDSWKIKCTVRDIIEERVENSITLAFEYNGFNISLISSKFTLNDSIKVTKTLTTMPQAIDKISVGFMDSHNIQSIALSYDSEKVKKLGDWISKALIIKDRGVHLACNYLIEDIPFTIPESVVRSADQVNLLSLKPNEKLSNDKKDYLKRTINTIKTFETEPTLDNALGYQLGYEDKCHRGDKFVHVKANSEIDECCFSDSCILYNLG